MKLSTRFFLLLLASIILPILVISTVVIVGVRDEAKNTFERGSSAELRHIDTGFTMYLNGLAEDAAFLANNPIIKQLDNRTTSYMDKQGDVMRPEQADKAEREAYMLMKAFGEARPDLAYVYLGMNQGGYLVYPTHSVAENYDPRTRSWYKNAVNSSTPVRIPAYKDLSSGAPLLDYVQRFEGKDGAFGSVGLDVTLEKFTEIVSTVQFGQRGFVLMVEDTGTILADPTNPDNNFKQLGEVNTYQDISQTPAGVTETEINGEPWYANVYLSPELGWKIIGFQPVSEVYAHANSLTRSTILIAVLMVVLFMGIGYVLLQIIIKPMQTITDGLEGIASGEGDLTQRLNIKSQDEAGKMADAFNRFVESINQLVANIKHNSTELNGSSHEASATAQEMKQISTGQLAAVEQVSTAFHQMVATSNEVANNCNQAASAADDSRKQVDEGNTLLKDTVNAVTQLGSTLNESNLAMAELSNESNNITVILDTIRGIAEQTNLLALNAAIEAARAGEQGRGFAVVADEVRTLAGRTAESTEEIDKLLNKLRTQTERVAQTLTNSIKHSETSVSASEKTSTVFESILNSVQTIRDMTTQIAASAEEQHLVAEEINRNITDIHDGASQGDTISEQVESSSEQLNHLASGLENLVSRFKTN